MTGFLQEITQSLTSSALTVAPDSTQIMDATVAERCFCRNANADDIISGPFLFRGAAAYV